MVAQGANHNEFLAIFQGMALEFEKLASFFKFQSISILAMLSDKQQ